MRTFVLSSVLIPAAAIRLRSTQHNTQYDGSSSSQEYGKSLTRGYELANNALHVATCSALAQKGQKHASEYSGAVEPLITANTVFNTRKTDFEGLLNVASQQAASSKQLADAISTADTIDAANDHVNAMIAATDEQKVSLLPAQTWFDLTQIFKKLNADSTLFESKFQNLSSVASQLEEEMTKLFTETKETNFICNAQIPGFPAKDAETDTQTDGSAKIAEAPQPVMAEGLAAPNRLRNAAMTAVSALEHRASELQLEDEIKVHSALLLLLKTSKEQLLEEAEQILASAFKGLDTAISAALDELGEDSASLAGAKRVLEKSLALGTETKVTTITDTAESVIALQLARPAEDFKSVFGIQGQQRAVSS